MGCWTRVQPRPEGLTLDGDNPVARMEENRMKDSRRNRANRPAAIVRKARDAQSPQREEKCCICQGDLAALSAGKMGHLALNGKRCCDSCHARIVVPARIARGDFSGWGGMS
jgi:hypothetical protein